VEHRQLLQALPSDTAFLDIARFPMFDYKATGQQRKWQPARYAAWVSRQRQPVRLFDLGPAQEIDDAVARVRQALATASQTIRQEGEPEAETALRQPLEKLARLVLHPLLPYLGTRERWIISPDGNLWLVPWAALPLPEASMPSRSTPSPTWSAAATW
jgi:hypothetical protein